MGDSFLSGVDEGEEDVVLAQEEPAAAAAAATAAPLTGLLPARRCFYIAQGEMEIYSSAASFDQAQPPERIGQLVRGDYVVCDGWHDDWARLETDVYAEWLRTRNVGLKTRAPEAWLCLSQANAAVVQELNMLVFRVHHEQIERSFPDGIRVRREPNTSSDVVGRLTTHDYVQVVDKKGDWLKLAPQMRETLQRTSRRAVYSNYDALCEGWTLSAAVPMELLVEVNPTVMRVNKEQIEAFFPGGVRVRRNPDTGSEQVGVLSLEDVVEVSECCGDWVKLSDGNLMPRQHMRRILGRTAAYTPFDDAHEGWCLYRHSTTMLLTTCTLRQAQDAIDAAVQLMTPREAGGAAAPADAPAELTMDDVLALAGLDVAEWGPRFRAEGVGLDIVKDLDDGMLRELGLVMGQRIKLLRVARELELSPDGGFAAEEASLAQADAKDAQAGGAGGAAATSRAAYAHDIDEAALRKLHAEDVSVRAALAAAGGGEDEVPEQVPEHFLDPILSEIMCDPVTTMLGNTYERSAIGHWLEGHDTDPLTNAVLPSKQLIPNNVLRSQIAEWKQLRIGVG